MSRYAPLNNDDQQKQPAKQLLGHRAKIHQDPRLIKAMFLLGLPAMFLFVVFVIVTQSSPSVSRSASPQVAPTGSFYPSGFNMKNNWGASSPYFDSGASFTGVEASLPLGSRLQQVHVLHRHGQRYPTTGIGHKMSKLSQRLAKMSASPHPSLSWLNTWNYTLGTELLVAPGVATEFSSGADFWASHGRFLYTGCKSNRFYTDACTDARAAPVLRATTQSRIAMSARAWAHGFFGSLQTAVKEVDPGTPGEHTNTSATYALVLQPEQEGRNNSLASYFSCPNSNNSTFRSGHKRATTWINLYLNDAKTRLQRLLPGYHNFTAADAFLFQNLCAYETAAHGSSAFCDLFTEMEWRGFEYASDLRFYGDSSYGSRTAAAEGAGWTAELLARLTNKPIMSPQYGINFPLVNSSQTFPLNQPLYMDMTHDSVIASVLTAFGLDFMKRDLPATKIPTPREFIVSRLTPFGARLYVELWAVPGSDEPLVRVKLNNRVLPLAGLKHCRVSKDNLCRKSDFAASLTHALHQIDFDQACFRE